MEGRKKETDKDIKEDKPKLKGKGLTSTDATGPHHQENPSNKPDLLMLVPGAHLDDCQK